MTENEKNYIYITHAKPGIAALSAAIAAGLVWGALVSEEMPFIISMVLWLIIAVVLLVMLGALITSSVQVDDRGNFTAVKTLGGIPFTTVHIRVEDILAVELNRRMTPGLERASDTGGASPDRPRFRLELVHRNGRFLIEAAAKDLSAEAARLAAALNRLVEKTGDWQS